jgi:tripartite-type tricarboxylate transporter receptor subunit TctC
MLAVADAAQSSLYGNLPTFKENGVDLVIGAFHGVYVPKGTPRAVIAKLGDALAKTMKSDDVRKNMENAGAGLAFLDGAEGKAYLAKQDDTYRGIIDKLGLRVAPAK